MVPEQDAADQAEVKASAAADKTTSTDAVAAAAAAREGAMSRREKAAAAAKAEAAAAPAASAEEEKAKTVNVTYLPRAGDPFETVFHGYTFVGNVPTPVKVAHTACLASCKTNPWFRVEGEEQAQSVSASGGKEGPRTADQYRAHAVDWINLARSSKELQARWIGEQAWRDLCGVGTDDLEWLNGFYTAKESALLKAEKEGF